MGIKKKIQDSHVMHVWRKNYEEVKAEKQAKPHRVSLFFVQVLRLFLCFFTIYFCCVVSILYLAPLLVSYIGGLMQVSLQSDLMMLLSTWIGPSFLGLGFLFAGTCFVIVKVCRFWTKCCNKMTSKLKNQSEKN